MNKIPCIKCDSKLWEYISPYLEKWGYTFEYITKDDWRTYPILVTNISSSFGLCGNISTYSRCYDRELVTDVEEFLEKAAELKGFTYKRNDCIMKFNGIVIRPGMVLVSSTGTIYIVFPAKGYLATVTYGEDISAYSCWFTLEHTLSSKDIVKVLDAPKSRITDGKVLWEKPKEVVITMEDIAEKFNCKVEQIRIKE